MCVFLLASKIVTHTHITYLCTSMHTRTQSHTCTRTHTNTQHMEIQIRWFKLRMREHISCSTNLLAHGWCDIHLRHGDGSVGTPTADQEQLVERVESVGVSVGNDGFLRRIHVEPFLPQLCENNNNKALLPYSTCKNYTINWNVVWRWLT